MPITPRTGVTILRVAALFFALAGAFALVAAFQEHKRTDVAQAVIWFSICVVFLSVARIRGKAIQSDGGDSSNKSQ